MYKPKRVLIAGLGYLGQALAAKLRAAGHQVYGLRRSSPADSDLPVILADLTDPESLRGRLPNVDILFYMPGAKRRDAEHYQRIYRDGLKHLLAAMPSPIQRLLYISSTSVYGQSQGEWVSESSLASPDSTTGRIIRAAEEDVFCIHPYATSLRLGGIYGPGRESFLDRIISGKELPDPENDRYTNRIYRDDAVAACMHLMECETLRPIYNVVDQDPASRNEVVIWILEQLGKKPCGVTQAGTSRGNKRVSSQLLADSGFGWTYPSYREGYSHLLRQRQH